MSQRSESSLFLDVLEKLDFAQHLLRLVHLATQHGEDLQTKNAYAAGYVATSTALSEVIDLLRGEMPDASQTLFVVDTETNNALFEEPPSGSSDQPVQ